MSGKRWTAQDEALLRELYPVTPTREVAAALGRSENAVGQRATKLGLKKAPGHGHEMPRRFWTDERREWFKGYVPGHSWHEISAEHERIFGTPLTKSQVQNAKHAMGVFSGTVGGRFEKGQPAWNKGRKQAEWMPPESIERTKATRFQKGQVHDRPDGWLKPIGYERLDKDGYIWVKVRDSRISGPQRQEPGHFNENWMPADSIERTKATRFKKGEVRDRPDGWLKPIGYERTDKDGYICVKVRDSRISGPQRQEPGHFNENWMPKNRHIWEQTHGEPVPPGHIVMFADHDRTNYDPGNLVAVPRTLWRIIVRLGLEYHDAESLQACMLMAQIAHVRRAKEKEAKRCRAGAR